MPRIAFASCARIRYRNQYHDGAPPYEFNTKDFNQPVWEYLLAQHTQNPLDALLLLGDQVYTDYCVGDRPRDWSPDVFHSLLYSMYAAQYAQVTSFKALIQALHQHGTPIGMVWDDHDFGYNNGHGTEPRFQNKMGSTRALFTQFLDVLNTAPATYPPIPALPIAAPAQGIERIANGLQLTEDVDVVMLDGRWYREDTKAANPQLLGEEQWRALKAKMLELPPNRLLIVCLGSTYSVAGLADESWAQERKGKPYAHFAEFTQLAKDKHIIFLSGDIHKNDFIVHDGFCEIISSGAYTPKELSCAGTWLAPANRHRFGLLEVYASQVKVKLFADNQIENTFPTTISRATGVPIP